MFQRLSAIQVAPLLLAGALGCASGKGSEVDDVAPEVRFESLRFEVFRGAALEATGHLAEARMRRDTSALAAEQVDVQFPPAPGREAASLRASRGTGNASERWFQLDGGVHGEQGTDVVTTERARYDGKDRLVRGDAEVLVRGEGYVLEGPGFTLDPDDRKVRIDGGATLRAGSAAVSAPTPAGDAGR
jgi:hypothetical protein